MVHVHMLDRPLAGLPELALIGTAEFPAAHQGLGEHHHGPCMEIVVFDRGRNSYTAAGKEFSMTGGEFFVTPPKLVHSSGDKPQDKARHAWIQIDLSPARGRRRFLDCAAGESLRRQLQQVPLMKGRAEPPLYPQLKALHGLCQLLREHTPGRKIQSVESAPAALAMLDLRTRLTRFLLDFLSAVDRTRSTTAPAEGAGAAASQRAVSGPAARADCSPAIAHAMAYMQANLAAPLAVRHIAQAAGYTVSAFKQAFRRETGLSPADYFLRLKIDEAKRRLQTEDAPITAIAADLGFSSGQYFATAFKRLTTRTPRAYREARR